MKNAVFTIMILWLIINGFIIYEFLKPDPVLNKENVSVNYIRGTLIYLGCPESKRNIIETGIRIAEYRTNINGVLITCLMFTESNFDYWAKSREGFKGLMQTPIATYIYPEVDILHGALILKDKLRIAGGNLRNALMLYKGGRNKIALRQADNVLTLYKSIKRLSAKQLTKGAENGDV